MNKPWHAFLGVKTDQEIADEFGLKKNTVAWARIRAEIPCAPGTKGGRWLWDDPANVALLGTMSDRELGKKLGVRYSSVQHARTVRGIGPGRPSGGNPKSADQRRESVTFRWPRSIVEKARRIGNARLEMLIALAEEQEQ